MRDLACTVGTAVAVLGLLTGCSTSGSSSTGLNLLPATHFAQQGQLPGVSPLTEVGTGGRLIAIQSDNVTEAGYDAATGTMTVLFDSGGLYEYYDVPAGLWEAFLAAQPHPWSAVGDPQLVNGGYRYSKLN